MTWVRVRVDTSYTIDLGLHVKDYRGYQERNGRKTMDDRREPVQSLFRGRSTRRIIDVQCIKDFVYLFNCGLMRKRQYIAVKHLRGEVAPTLKSEKLSASCQTSAL